MGEAHSTRRAALLASLSIEVRRLLPQARAVVIKHRVGSKGWWVTTVLGPGGQRFESPDTRRAVQRAVADILGVLAPYLPSTEQVTLELAGPRQLRPMVSTGQRAMAQRRRVKRSQTTKPYRVLSTSKLQGTETRRYRDGSVVTVDTRHNTARRSEADPR